MMRIWISDVPSKILVSRASRQWRSTGVQGGVAAAAVDLERFARDALGHLRGEQLHHRGFLVAADALVDLVADGVHQRARGFDLGRHARRS